MTTYVRGGSDTPVTDYAQLRNYFLQGAKPEPEWGIGAETERIAIDARTGEAPGYERVATLLQRIAESEGWQPIYDGDALIGVQGGRSAIALEPGGQIELSGELCRDLVCCNRDNDYINGLLAEHGRDLGLRFLGLGSQPFSTLDQIGWVPKKRYGIMGPYMRRCGDMGERMMKQTAGLQVNLDFRDERDCMAKLRAGQLLVPLFYALFANSPFLDGAPSGFLTSRGEIWRRTDIDRCGAIPGLLDPAATIDVMVDHALQVPLYFVERDGHFVDLTTTRVTFADLMAGKVEGIVPTMTDWGLHLSTIFTEVRLRPQVEIRSVDSLPPAAVLSFAALVKGILYDDEAMQAVDRLMLPEGADPWIELYPRVWREGLAARYCGRTMLSIVEDVLDLAAAGLVRWRLATEGRDESHFLQPARDLVAGGKTFAEILLETWPQDRPNQIAALLDHCGYPP